MHTANRKNLIATIHAARRFADEKATNPYVRTCRLTSDGETLRIATSNLRTFYEAPTAAPRHSATPVSLCVKIKDIVRVLRSLRGESVELSDHGGDLEIRQGTRRFLLPGLDAYDFPEPAPGFEEPVALAPADALHVALSRVLPSISKGALLDLEDGRMHWAGTDGHRLTVHEIEASTNVDLWCNLLRQADISNAIVPRDVIAFLVRTLMGQGGDVAVRLSSKAQFIRLDLPGGIVLVTHLKDGEFPDYRLVLEGPAPAARVVLRRAALLETLRTVCKGFDFGRCPVIRVEVNGTTIAITASCPSTGRFQDELSIVRRRGARAPITVGLNPFFVQDAIDGISSEEVELGMTDEDRMVRFQLPGNEGWNQTVLMPVRL